MRVLAHPEPGREPDIRTEPSVRSALELRPTPRRLQRAAGPGPRCPDQRRAVVAQAGHRSARAGSRQVADHRRVPRPPHPTPPQRHLPGALLTVDHPVSMAGRPPLAWPGRELTAV